MGLFDHLFKTKSPTGDERLMENAPEGSASAKGSEPATRTATPQRADPSAFLHPKNFVPRGAPTLTPAPRPSSSVSGKPSERRPVPGSAPPSVDEIVLTLGDVLSRIPTHYLKQGTHDPKRELCFKINDLSSDIARGRAAVPLSRIAQLVPDIFVKEIGRDEDTEVRLPLQKLVEQIGLLRSRPKAPMMEKTARQVAPAELTPAGRPIVDIEARKEVVREVNADSVSPLEAGQPPTPAVVLGEMAPAQRVVELKPFAEVAVPVVLGPPPPTVEPLPVVEPSPVISAPQEPALATPAAAIPAAAEPPLAPPTTPEPVSEPAPPISAFPSIPFVASVPPAPPVEPAPPVAPSPIVIDWAAAAAGPSEPSRESTIPKIVVEPPYKELVVTSTRLAPVESPELDPGEEKIQLSLAAILRHCPQEIIVGPLPHIDDSVRITLPFAPIDRQLIRGQVEVSSLRFVVALPEMYQKFFVAKVGVKVPIPLEEVFQNLPRPVHELTPAPPSPQPYVLAPVPASEVVPPAIPAPAAEAQPPAPLVPILEPVSAFSAFTSVRPSVKIGESPSEAHAPSEEAPAGHAIGEAPASLEAPPVAVSLSEPPPLAPAVPLSIPPIGIIEPTSIQSPPESQIVPPIGPSDSSPAPVPQKSEPTLPQDDFAAASAPPPFAEEPPKLVLQRPTFRPFLVPPPPIFGFAPPSAATPEPELPARIEPPSLLTSLTEPLSPPISDSAAVPAAEAPAVETPAAVEASVPAGTEPAPTSEMIGLAAEDLAPEMLASFSLQPVPFADLAETLAHETTYAADLAEVVHVETPDAGPVAPQPTPAAAETNVEEKPSAAEPAETSPITAAAESLAAEQPVPPVEHPSAPVVEAVAAAAFAATVGEALPRPGRKRAPKAAPVGEPAEPAAPAEEVEHQAGPAAVDETSAAAVPPPPPHPPFSLPKLPSESAHVEVFPPPSLPLRRFDQDAVQALFMTEETLDLPKISRLAASLPGVYACVIATRDQACTGGNLPEGFDLAALLGLAPRVGEAAGRMPIGQLKHFTLYGEAYSVSFFERNGLSLCAVHRPRSFVPGVREKLVALADELSH